MKVGQPPGARVRGDLVFFRLDSLKPDDTVAIAEHLIEDQQMLDNLHVLKEYDGSYEVSGLGRFRVNVYRQRMSLAIVMRVVPAVVPTLEQLGDQIAGSERFAPRKAGVGLDGGAISQIRKWLFPTRPHMPTELQE